VQLEANLRHAVVAGQRGQIGPERDGLVPLPLEDFEVLNRPAIDNPVRQARLLGITRAPGLRDNRRDPKQLGQPDGVADDLRMLLTQSRMERKRGAVQTLEDQAAAGDRVEPALARLRIFQQLIEAQVRRARLPTRGDLDGLHANLDREVQRLLERELADRIRIEANLHRPEPYYAARSKSVGSK